MNVRMRYILATVSAVLAGALTLVFLSGRGAANEADAEIIWVARQAIPPGARLSEEVLQRVRVDGPTRRLLAPETLPSAPTDSPGDWYAIVPLEAGQALIPGRTVESQPSAGLPAGLTPDDMRVVSLEADATPAGSPVVGEEVDLYALPANGGAAVRILSAARVTAAEEGLISVLVPEPQVGTVLTASAGAPVKVVRRLGGGSLR